MLGEFLKKAINSKTIVSRLGKPRPSNVLPKYPWLIPPKQGFRWFFLEILVDKLSSSNEDLRNY